MKNNSKLMTIALSFLVVSFAALAGCDDVESACESFCEQAIECELEEGEVDDCVEECVADAEEEADEVGSDCMKASAAFMECLGNTSDCDEFGDAIFAQSDACEDQAQAMEEACAEEEEEEEG